jgi:hypothetical protein
MKHTVPAGNALHEAYAANYVAGVRRRTLGMAALSRPTAGAGLQGRLGLAEAVRLGELREALRELDFELAFKAGPAAPTSMGSVPALDLPK